MTKIEEAMRKLEVARQTGEAAPGESPYLITRPASAHEISEHIVAFHHPRAAPAESFRQLRIVIHNLARDQFLKTIGFTSSVRGEGSSTTALNFAVALAQDLEQDILVVDADLQQPSQHSLLGLGSSRGLVDLLTQDVNLDSAIHPTAVPRLFLLAAGLPPGNPTELFNSPQLPEIFGQLRERFEYVIVDSTPILAGGDTVYLSEHLDGLILVVEAGRTNRKYPAQALELLGKANLLGLVLNKVTASGPQAGSR